MNKSTVLFLWLTAAIGCRSESPSAVTLNADNNGQMIELRANTPLVVTLDSNRTTGYQWNLVTPPDDKVLKFVKSEYVGPSNSMPGAGGAEEWSFQAIGPGATSVNLAYFRTFDPEKDLAGEFSFAVKVN